MSTDRHRLEVQLFEAACDLPADEQTAFVRAQANGDTELERRVLSLLERDRGNESGGLTSPGAPGTALASADLTQTPPERIGGYRIVGPIGSGGMGIVYEAEQEQPRRSVALKVLGTGLITEEHVRRFEHEVEVLGWLEHPGIASIFEAGIGPVEAGGETRAAVPFFAMELIRGKTLREHATEADLDVRARLDLLAKICDAVHHAHQKGVVHRDLKPGNVLVEANGQPKVLDFGIARAMRSDLDATTLHTQPGQLLGTLPYMSPEQVAGDPAYIDTRTDVYALGVIGYELLSERLPIDVSKTELIEAARAIQEVEPPLLGLLDRRLRGDIETIVAKAIEKERHRRYASAEELASDIRRYLANEPILARPPSAVYQLTKFARRNRALVGGVVGIFVALLVGLIVSLRLYNESEERGEQLALAVDEAKDANSRAQDALVKERAARDEIERTLIELRRTEDYFDSFFAAATPYTDGTNVRVVEVLDRMASEVDAAFPERPLAQARLLRRVGGTYRSIGLVSKGLAFVERADELMEIHAEPDSDDAIDTLEQLAMCLQGAERFDEAVVQYRELIDRLSARSELDAPRLLKAYLSMAECLVVLSRLNEGEVAAKESLRLADLIDSGAPADRASCSHVLAAIHMQRGTFDQAWDHIQDAMELRERGYSTRWDFGTTLHLAAQISIYRGDFEEAERLIRRSIELSNDAIGDDHPAILSQLETLGVIYAQTSRNEEALTAFEDALAMADRILESPNGSHATLLTHMGLVYMRMRDYESAEGYLREAIDELRDALETGLDLSNAVSNLGNTLMRAGRFEEALPFTLEALEIREAIADPNHYRIGYDYDVLADIKEGLGDFEGAAEAQARADAIAAANAR